jgi:hypothetical protein
MPGTLVSACRRFSTAPANRKGHGCNDHPSGGLHDDNGDSLRHVHPSLFTNATRVSDM